jgi:hypothetical protein
LCLSSVKVKGNISASAQIVQDCSIAVNYSGPNPMTSPAASGGLNVSGGAQAIQDSTGTRVTATPATTTYNTPPVAAAAGVSPPPIGTPPVAAATESDGSTLLITNPTVANVLNTKTKQYGAIGGCIFIILCCCCILILLMSGDSEGPSGPSAANIAFARLSTAGS